MKKRTQKRMVRVLLTLLVITLLTGLIAVPFAQAAEYEASYIKKLENISVDYTKYLDTSVMQKLPDTIQADREISVIILLDNATVLDAYGAGNRTMSLKEFALESEEAEDIRADLAEKKAQILKSLDEKGIAYETGADYDTLLSGFELVIKAGDFDITAKSLGEGNGIYVCEEYEVAQTQLVENTVNVYDTGIFKSGESGYDGTGMVVAVLDTGLDSDHLRTVRRSGCGRCLHQRESALRL